MQFKHLYGIEQISHRTQ